MALIELSNITKKYPDGESRYNHILRGVNLNVEEGGFVAIMGQSGSGKTTLLSILGALLQPDDGNYILNGKDILTSGVNLAEVRNRQIGFVFQEHRLMPQLNVLDNILLPTLAFNSEADNEQTDYAKFLMKITGIEGITHQYPQTISGGEASRVAVCRALIMKPLLVLADEPTGQLDSDNSEKITALLTKINRELRTTIIMVTHSKEVASVASQILTLKDGVLS